MRLNDQKQDIFHTSSIVTIQSVSPVCCRISVCFFVFLFSVSVVVLCSFLGHCQFSQCVIIFRCVLLATLDSLCIYPRVSLFRCLRFSVLSCFVIYIKSLSIASRMCEIYASCLVSPSYYKYVFSFLIILFLFCISFYEGW